MASSQRKVPLRLAKRGRELRYSRVLTQRHCSRSGAVTAFVLSSRRIGQKADTGEWLVRSCEGTGGEGKEMRRKTAPCGIVR